MAQTATKQTTQAQAPISQGAVSIIEKPRLPYNSEMKEHYGITPDQWRTLVDAIFPSAKTVTSVALALSYCKSRNLDVFKRPVHIVPIWRAGDKDRNERGRYVETVWPGISELRTTAARTKQYAGIDETEFGPRVSKTWTVTYEDDGRQQQQREVTVEFPEWARITVYRIVGDQVRKFVGPKCVWLETYATIGKSDVPNQMWCDRPEGQLEKCAEAAALRRAFPEEIGNEYTDDEIGHASARTVIEDKIIAVEARGVEAPKQPEPKPSDPPPEQQAAQAEPTQDDKVKVWLQGVRQRLIDCDNLAGVEAVEAHIKQYAARIPSDVMKDVDKLLEMSRKRFEDAAEPPAQPAPELPPMNGNDIIEGEIVDEPPL